MGMTPDEALAAVREKRGIVNPNAGFLLQLKKYAAQVKGEGGEAQARQAKRESTGGPQQKELDSNTTSIDGSPGTSAFLSSEE